MLRMPRILLTLVAAALLLTTACDPAGTGTGGATPTAAPSSAARTTPATCPAGGRLPNGDCAGGTSPANRLANDPIAPTVCPKILKAMGTQAIYNDPDAMEAIGKEAGTSLDLGLALAGDILAGAARSARLVKGTSDEPEKKIGMGSAATQLATVCTKAGFQ